MHYLVLKDGEPVYVRVTDSDGLVVNTRSPLVCHSREDVGWALSALFGGTYDEKSFTLKQISDAQLHDEFRGYWHGLPVTGWSYALTEKGNSMSWECWCPESIFGTEASFAARGPNDHDIPGSVTSCPWCNRPRDLAVTPECAERAFRIGLGDIHSQAAVNTCPICAPALPPAPEVVGAHKFLAKVAETLSRKNAQYGRSAAEPMRVFSRASTTEQIKVRIDDKLSRLARGTNIVDNEDVLLDLVGYLALLAALRENESPGG